MYSPGAFQTAAAFLCLRSGKFVHKPFKNGVLVFSNLPALLDGKPHRFSKTDVTGTCFLVPGPQDEGAQCGT